MNHADTTTRTMSYAARFLALNAEGASDDHLVDANLTETARFTVQTRRVGDGPNGVPLPNLPTEWWDHDTFDTLDEALTVKRQPPPRSTVTGVGGCSVLISGTNGA